MNSIEHRTTKGASQLRPNGSVKSVDLFANDDRFSITNSSLRKTSLMLGVPIFRVLLPLVLSAHVLVHTHGLQDV
jgi:hypothetical protein